MQETTILLDFKGAREVIGRTFEHTNHVRARVVFTDGSGQVGFEGKHFPGALWEPLDAVEISPGEFLIPNRPQLRAILRGGMGATGHVEALPTLLAVS